MHHSHPVAVSFLAVMAKKQPTKKTAAINFRMDAELKDRLDNFIITHPLQPSVVNVVQRAVREYLDREEPNLPKPARSK